MIKKFLFDTPNLKIYHYKFDGLEETVKIEAYSDAEGREILRRNILKLPEAYRKSKVIGVSCTTPLFGVTEMNKNNSTMVWVGKKHSQSGWIKKDEFEKRLKR